MKYSILTFGCRVNQADSLAFEEQFLGHGDEPTSPEAADVVVVNTCSVTASADQGARQTLRRIARTNPNAQIIVTGCYATRRPDELRALPNVVSVVPNDDKPRLMSLVRSVQRHPGVDTTSWGDLEVSTAERFGSGDGHCGAAIQPGVAGRTAFTLRVQTGCAELCSYCIIPSTRGVPRSVPVLEVVKEVERISQAGFKEIAITGVHLGSYGRDLSPVSSLRELLAALATRSGSREAPDGNPAVVFRISSLEPMDCTLDIVQLVAENEIFAPHFHLPLQHASNRVLQAMCRPYTIEYYSRLVRHIRSFIPHASIGSDVIVGFPGESEEDFDQLAEYLQHSPLTHVHVFPYSDRPGTPATALQHKVPGSLVRERAHRLRDIASLLSRRFRASQVGNVFRALTLDDGASVVTGNYLKMRIPPGRARNEWVHVRITSADLAMSAEVIASGAAWPAASAVNV